MDNTVRNRQFYRLNGLAFLLLVISLILVGCGGSSGSGNGSDDDASDPADELATEEVEADDDSSDADNGAAGRALAELGEQIFFDTNLSNPVGQSCGSCHDPAAGFADPASVDKLSPVSVGADGVSVGTRNSPTASYAAFIPDFSGTAPFFGGQFLDGRASRLEEQARAPFLNPLEMNMADEAAVVTKLQAAIYADEFIDVFGPGAFDNISTAYTSMVTAIAAFERTDTFAPFSSNFDLREAGFYTFTAAETNGETLFNGKAQCNLCHITPGSGAEIFSDFRYSNIGVPANPAIMAGADNGLGAALSDPDQNGKFRTPTLRNVADTAPYMHNGVFDTLEEVMAFYNERDVVPVVVPEVATNVDNRGNLGELNLTPTEIQDVIAFLMTLSDN